VTQSALDYKKISVYLLGEFRITLDGKEVKLPNRATVRSLMAFLFAQGKRTSRSTLIYLFWPHLADRAAGRALSQALWHIRKSLPKELLITKNQQVQIAHLPNLWVDVWMFRQVTELLLQNPPQTKQKATYYQCLELYQGGLAEDIYEDWALAERRFLHDAHLTLLQHLVQIEKASGQYATALKLAQRAAAAAPLDEAWQQEIMQLYVVQENLDAAISQYETYRNTVRRELNIEPAGEIRLLAQQIALRSGAKSKEFAQPWSISTKQSILETGRFDELPVIGREHEQKKLISYFDLLVSNAGGIISITGPAGTGKTHLLRSFADHAGWHGIEVYWSDPVKEAMAHPFASILQLLEEILDRLDVKLMETTLAPIWLQVLCTLSPLIMEKFSHLSPPPQILVQNEAERNYEAIIQFFIAVAQFHPLLLIMEDLQWAGDETVTLLSRLAHRIKDRPILVAFSYTTLGTNRTLPSQTFWFCNDTINLHNLDEAGASELIRHTLGRGQPAPRFERRLYSETGGNPLFILETLRFLYERQLIVRDAAGYWSTAVDEQTEDYRELPLAPVIKQAIEQRLRGLPTTLRRILNAAAVLGAKFTLTELQTITLIEDHLLHTVVNVLARRGYITGDFRRYQFSHYSLFQTVYANVPETERIQMHRRAGHMFEGERHTDIERLAYHYTKGKLWHKAVHAHLKASRTAEKMTALQAAKDHVIHAQRLLNEHHPFAKEENQRLYFETLAIAARLNQQMGNHNDARAELAQMGEIAAQLSAPRLEVDALNGMVELQLSLFQLEKALALAETAVRRAAALPYDEALADAYHLSARIYRHLDNQSRAQEFWESALEIWRNLPDTDVKIADAYIYLASISIKKGDPRQAQITIFHVLETLQNTNLKYQFAKAYATLSQIEHDFGNHEQALQYNLQALEQIQAIGIRYNEAVILANLGLSYWRLGDFGQGEAYFQQSLQIARETAAKPVEASALFNLGELYRQTGRLTEGEALLCEALALARELNFPDVHICSLNGLGNVALEHQQLTQAKAYFDHGYQLAQEATILKHQVEALWGIGQFHIRNRTFAQALDALHTVLSLIQHREKGDIVVSTHSLLGYCYYSMGDLAKALVHSEQAVKMADKTGADHENQMIYYFHWLILRSAGRTYEAQTALQQAFQLVQERKKSIPTTSWQQVWAEKQLNRRILRDYQAQQAEQNLQNKITAHLPRQGTPLHGRPIRADELIPVTWTIETPQDGAVKNKKARRRKQIRRLLQEAAAQGAIPLQKEIADALQVSERTIRRDLREMGL
jgi:DNA-binding SARP family transcriptional activator/predicted ATPase